MCISCSKDVGEDVVVTAVELFIECGNVCADVDELSFGLG